MSQMQKYQIMANAILQLLQTLNVKCNDIDIDNSISGLRLYKLHGNEEMLKEIAAGIIKFTKNNKEKILNRDESVLNNCIHYKINIVNYISKYITLFCKEEKEELWELIDNVIKCAINTF